MKTRLLERDDTVEILFGVISLLLLLLFMSVIEAMWFLVVGALLLASIRVASSSPRRSLMVFCFSLLAMGKVDPGWLPFISIVALPYAEYLSALGKVTYSLLAGEFFLRWEAYLLFSAGQAHRELATFLLEDLGIFAFAILLGAARNLWVERTRLTNEVHHDRIHTLHAEFGAYLHQHIASTLVKIILLARAGHSNPPTALRKIEEDTESTLSLVRSFVEYGMPSVDTMSNAITSTLAIIEHSGWKVIRSLDDDWPLLLAQSDTVDVAAELLLNALKYGDRGMPLGFSIQRRTTTFVIACTNARSDTSERPVGGNGLGLELIRHKINALQGTLDIDIEPGRWTAVCTIPLEATSRFS